MVSPARALVQTIVEDSFCAAALLDKPDDVIRDDSEASKGLMVDPPETQGGTAQLRLGKEVLGTVDQVYEDGERSWAVTLIVLAEDLNQ